MKPIFRKPTGFSSKKRHCEKGPFGCECKYFKINNLGKRLKHVPR